MGEQATVGPTKTAVAIPSPAADGIQNRELFYGGVLTLVIGLVTVAALLTMNRFKWKWTEGMVVAVAMVVAAILLIVGGKGVDNLPSPSPTAIRIAWGLGLLAWMTAFLLAFISLRRQIGTLAAAAPTTGEASASTDQSDMIDILPATKEDFGTQCFRIQVKNASTKSRWIGANITAIDPEPHHPQLTMPFPLQIMNHPNKTAAAVPPGEVQLIDVFRLHGPEGVFAILGATNSVEIKKQKFTLTISAYAEDGGSSQRKFAIVFGGEDRAKLETVD